MTQNQQPGAGGMLLRWWNENRAQEGLGETLARLAGGLWEFARDSTPLRRRQRYGDVDYDWDFRVDTTSAAVGWRDRLLGALHSPYQATEPALFHEMLSHLKIDFRDFTFIDLGSGKGRALLMAADLPFRRILGVELLPALHEIALENILRYKSESLQCLAVESVCGDAREFVFPPEPFVLYLFNPLPEAGLLQTIQNLDSSLRENPRKVYVLYHNPLLEHVLAKSVALKKEDGTEQYSIYSCGMLSE
jgi:SAM-dependent methyltransferase